MKIKAFLVCFLAWIVFSASMFYAMWSEGDADVDLGLMLLFWVFIGMLVMNLLVRKDKQKR